MQLTLTNSATRKKELFEPLDPSRVRMYACGTTVYDRAHIGNARPAIVFDVLFRLLRHIYGEEHVIYVRNITDVDDKINARAREEGVSIETVTERTIKILHEDLEKLNTLEPSVEPRATRHIPEMIAMIEALIAKGNAYEAEGHVLFDVPSMPGYGALSGRSVDDMIAGARIDVAPYKKDPMDFVLWKPSSGDEPGWDSPWGRGRPGWHIECSAMSKAYLDETFDIHAGGIDLLFPHHENERAQSMCAHDGAPFAKVWLHNGFLQVEGQKMSKSLGNFLTIGDFLKDWPGEVLRLQMLMTHYRQPLNWTETASREVKGILDRWYDLTDQAEVGEMPEGVLHALSDDLNTPLAIAEMHKLADGARHGSAEAAGALKAAMGILGLPAHTAEAWRTLTSEARAIDGDRVDALIRERNQARKERNFARADEIRDELAALGVQLKDGADGTTWTVAP